MFKFLRFFSRSSLLLASIGLCFACGESNVDPDSMTEPDLIVGNSPWPGFAAQFIAEDKGFYDTAGVNVQEKHTPVSADLGTDLLLGKVDMAWIGVNELLEIADGDDSLKLIAVSDYSNGADGIVARGVSDPEDLVGKVIAWEELPLQSILLSAYLKGSNVQPSQLQFQTMRPAAAKAAFLAQRVDAAIAYEPWLSEIAEASDGQIIFNSENTGLVAAVLVGREDFIADRKTDIVAYLQALEQGTQFYEDHPEEAIDIAADKLGIEDSQTLLPMMNSVRLVKPSEHSEIVFNQQSPLNIVNSMRFAAQVGKATGEVRSSVDPNQLYDDSLVKAYRRAEIDKAEIDKDRAAIGTETRTSVRR